MLTKQYNGEEIIHKFIEGCVLLAQGNAITLTCKELGVTDNTFYRWRKVYGRIRVD